MVQWGKQGENYDTYRWRHYRGGEVGVEQGNIKKGWKKNPFAHLKLSWLLKIPSKGKAFLSQKKKLIYQNKFTSTRCNTNGGIQARDGEINGALRAWAKQNGLTSSGNRWCTEIKSGLKLFR